MSELKTSDSPIDLTTIKPVDVAGLSTTARLLVSFTKTYFGVPDMVYDSTLARSTSVYAEFGKLFEKLESTTDVTYTRAATREILEKLQTATTPSAKASYDSLSRDAIPAFEQSEELEKKAELLRQKCREDRDKAFEALESALSMVSSAKTPEEKEEILNHLIMAEKTRQTIKVELEKLEKASLVSDSQLRKIANSAFTALPSKDRASVSPPPSPTPTITG